jgi:CheY-like chemotaxis protein
MDATFLTLLAAAVVLVFVPLERLTSLKAGQFEITLERTQIEGAVRSLPLTTDEDKRLRAALERVEPNLGEVQGGRVLWVDDHPHTILGERRLLRALGINVIPASSSDEALEVLERDNDFDLMISDIQRRGANYKLVERGGEVIREIVRRKDEPTRSFVVVMKQDGTRIVEIHDGVNFVAGVLRKSNERTLRELPVIFYSAYRSLEILAKNASLVPDARVCNAPSALILESVRAISDARAHPIKAPSRKRGTRVEALTDSSEDKLNDTAPEHTSPRGNLGDPDSS